MHSQLYIMHIALAINLHYKEFKANMNSYAYIYGKTLMRIITSYNFYMYIRIYKFAQDGINFKKGKLFNRKETILKIGMHGN